MKKQDFKKKFPDLDVRKLEFPQVLSRKAIEDKVTEMVEFLETGLLAYEADGRTATVFMSDAFGRKLQTMTKGETVLDEQRGITGTIVSEKPVICGLTMCVRVDIGGSVDLYECTYFK